LLNRPWNELFEKEMMMPGLRELQNYFGGEWIAANASETLIVTNPATAEPLAKVPLTSSRDVDMAVCAADEAYISWRAIPAEDRIQFLFRLKALLDEHHDELASLITKENGKTVKESKGELKRAIENVEVACGIPSMMMGDFSEDIAQGIDEIMIRQPLGVCAIISPFNFPGMIPFWFLPYAVATGNTVVIKPSERTPMTMLRMMDLFEMAGFPRGVVNLVNGGPDSVNALLDHPKVKAVSFVGSTPVARHIYSRASANGKRVQAQAGAKNVTVILPDADLESTIKIVADSAFGNAGQRCLATSLVITVGRARQQVTDALAETARSRKVGYGLVEGVEMGPVITPESKARIASLIDAGFQEGASILVDGREVSVPGYEAGYFLRPTILQDVPVDGKIFKTEIFGPVLGMLHVDSLDEAIAIINSHSYGNMACLFTANGAAARQFRSEVEAGNIGINIGVAAPMAFFPFSGWKDSFFGSLHGQAGHAVEFFSQTKIVVERWLKEWTREF
jgi:malonate-semialdehyde dehydrogenase (acetylating)/methylmalonate-semialdehyde dehydrogenase